MIHHNQNQIHRNIITFKNIKDWNVKNERMGLAVDNYRVGGLSRLYLTASVTLCECFDIIYDSNILTSIIAQGYPLLPETIS